MPGRNIPLINDHYYHVYNRGISHIPVFVSKRGYQRFIELIKYYRFSQTPLSFSKLKRITKEERNSVFHSLEKKGKKLVEILCFCLMPNHFHLILGQTQKNGISKFLSQIQNGYTKYFNTKNDRAGPLFQSKFKAVLVETEEQLLHLSRYIHLNPYSSAIVKNFKELTAYPWSSLSFYISDANQENQFCQTETIKSYLKDKEEYKKFVFDQAEYQKELEYIKHLTLE